MAEKKKPGDLSHLGRHDPVAREASAFPYLRQAYGKRTESEVKGAEKGYSEAVRREYRQSEDEGAYLKRVKHHKN